MFVGETGSGKSSLISALSGNTCPAAKAMAVVYCGPFINTPGEFLENRRFYPALITAAMDCDILCLVQDASRKTSLFPPLFCSAFNCRTIGIVSKVDLENADPSRAERFLASAGVKETVRASCITKEGLARLELFLTDNSDSK